MLYAVFHAQRGNDPGALQRTPQRAVYGHFLWLPRITVGRIPAPTVGRRIGGITMAKETETECMPLAPSRPAVKPNFGVRLRMQFWG